MSETEILSRLYPSLADACRRIQTQARAGHVLIRWTSGLRTWAEQLRLWMQGRDTDGRIVDRRRVVTFAQPGESLHNYGLAADFVLLRIDGSGVEWSGLADLDADGILDWLEVGRLAEVQDLVWGGRWPKLVDMPHVEVQTTLALSALKALYEEGGVAAVWMALREAP